MSEITSSREDYLEAILALEQDGSEIGRAHV